MNKERKLRNPFLVSGYFGAEYFCDRHTEMQNMLRALRNGRNVTLISPRRMGKTGLIRHVFEHIEKESSQPCFYIDIFPTQNLYDFVRMLGDAVLGNLDDFSEGLITRIVGFFKSCKPVITADPMTGAPEISLDIEPAHSEESLKEIFGYLKLSGKECYIAIDEFQQITEYPEKGVEALLRSYIQFLPNVHFIFSGSKKHIMEMIFTSASRPFYQSTQSLSLKEIPVGKYYEFADALFNHNSQNISTQVFAYLYNKVGGHTWYVQYLLNRLYDIAGSVIDVADVDQALVMIVEEESDTFQTYYRMLTSNQQRLLLAIAHEGSVRNITSSEFVSRYRLKAASSVKTSLQNLIEKELVLPCEDSYIVYNRFFSLWLSSIRI